MSGMSRRPEFIIWHCSASEFGDVVIIDSWHRARGFRCIGYNAIILNGILTKRDYLKAEIDNSLDGLVQFGRSLDLDKVLDKKEIPAATYGLNSRSVALCLIGNQKFSRKQIESALKLTEKWQRQFAISVEGVIGHYEVGKIDPRFATKKTCPNIDMLAVRKLLYFREFIEGILSKFR